MKTKVALFLSFIALLLCDGGQKAQAQIDIFPVFQLHELVCGSPSF